MKLKIAIVVSETSMPLISYYVLLIKGCLYGIIKVLANRSAEFASLAVALGVINTKEGA